jgi:hypothetical protein
MKKLIALLLALVLVALLASCNFFKKSSSKDDDDNNDDKNKTEDVADEKDNDDEKSIEDKEFGRGTTEENRYNNSFLDFKFTKPENWIYTTDEEFAAMLNLGTEYLGDRYKEALKNNPLVYDMMARDVATGSSVTVAYENLSKTFASNITEEQYMTALKSQLPSVSGMNYQVVGDVENVTIGETEFLRLTCTVSASGVNGIQIYNIHKIDGYMALILYTIMGDDLTVAEVDAMFN